jgi:N,N'-diacetylchitobiose transport system substrate-binding protein
MRFRIIAVVAGLAAVLAVTVAVSAAAGKTQRTSADSITVWLQPEAKSGWQAAIDAATAAFQAKHPGVQVNVEEQQWTEHLAKLDASLAAGTVPDVVEMGNTETTKYMAAGAFADLTSAKSSFPNSGTWLKGLADSATYNGRLYGVPYYAGARAVIYNKALYKGAGIKRTPRTLDDFVADGQKLMAKYGSDPNFSAFYFAGRNWHNGMAWVYDYGGAIARFKGGQWVGTLESPQAVAGLTKLKSMVLSLSRATKTNDEAHPWQALVFSKGKVASFLGNGWEWGQATDKKGGGNPKIAPLLAAYPMPSHVKGQYLPTFIGGSDLAIPAASPNKDLAIDWIAAFTSSANETLIAKAGNIANTTTLAGVNKSNPQLYPFALAAKNSWFIPTAKNWASVEKSFVLENMLVSIFTNKATVQDAAKKADDQIESLLNEGA